MHDELRDLSRKLYSELMTDVVVVSPIGGGSWVFEESFQRVQGFPSWVSRSECCGIIGDMPKFWEWCHRKRLTCCEVKFNHQ